MKKLFFIAVTSAVILSCQQETTDTLQRPATSTRDSLVGNWGMDYSYILTYSDSSFTVVTDSFYYGAWGPAAFLRLSDDSTQRQFLSENPVPPFYGNGASGRWRYEDGLRRIWVSHEIYSMDSGWVNTLPHPPPNGLFPMYWIQQLEKDRMVLFIRGIGTNPPRYTRTYDVFRRRR